MTTSTFAPSYLLLLFTLFPNQSRATPMSLDGPAEEIVEACAEAMGGWESIRSLETLAFDEPPRAGGPPVRWKVLVPKKVRREKEGGFILLFDGSRAGFLEVPWETDESSRAPGLLPEEHWPVVELDLAPYLPAFFYLPWVSRGEEGSERDRTHLIEVTFPLGGIAVYHIDPDSFLPIRIDFPQHDFSMDLGDFREVGGILFPHRNNPIANPTQVTVIENVRVNPDIDPERFVLPSHRFQTDQEIRQVTNREATDYHPIFSPSGTEVLFTSRVGDEASLFRVPIEGGEPTMVPIGITGDLYSDWHPDGQSIVFDSRNADAPPDIYRYWLDSGDLRRLTDHPGMDGHPSFSPGGDQIVFMSMRGGTGDIWIMDVDGTNLRQLTHDSDTDWHPKWSPDGSEVLFTSDREGDTDIWALGVDGTGLRRLTSQPGPEDRAVWSPDGSRVVFQWEGDLWLVDSRGGDPERLTDFPGREGNPAWSPDGRSIVFGADRSGRLNLWMLSVGGA